MASCMGVKYSFRMRLCMFNNLGMIGKAVADMRLQDDVPLQIWKVRPSPIFPLSSYHPLLYTHFRSPTYPKATSPNNEQLASDQNVS